MILLKKIFMIIYWLIIITAFLIVSYDSNVKGQNGRVEIITVHGPSLVNNLLNDPPTREVSVYLPADYDQNPSKHFAIS